MHEASASGGADGGRDFPSPSPIPVPLPKRSPQVRDASKYYPISRNAYENPIPLSCPANQFESFEQSLQDSDVISSAVTTPLPNDSVIPDANMINKETVEHLLPISMDHSSASTSSVCVSQHLNSIPSSRSQLPTLINSNVQNFSESPMEIDVDGNNSRKRSLSSLNDKKSNAKAKKPIKDNINLNLNSRDPLADPNNKDNNIILYSNTDCPPFIVHVYSTNEDPSGPMHPLLISRSLSRIAYSDIKEIKKIGRGKVLAEMNSAKSANNLVLNSDLNKENLRAFIPSYRIVRTGIVKDIPLHLDETDLLQFFDSPFKVVEVRRLNRRQKIDGEIKYLPSRTICLKFAGQILPKYIFLCRNRYEVSPYVSRVKICFSCQRIGHISKNCRGKARCLFCGGDKHDPPSTCPKKDSDGVKCINCQGDHLATSFQCPLIERHKRILALAASENIPIVEAKRKILQHHPVPKDIIYDYNNFPLLNSNRTSPHDNCEPTSNFNSASYPQNNRFSYLNALNQPDNASDNVPSHSHSSNSTRNQYKQLPSRPKNQTHSLNYNENGNGNLPRYRKSPQKSPKNKVNGYSNLHNELLYSPNGRLPNSDYCSNNCLTQNSMTSSLNNPATHDSAHTYEQNAQLNSERYHIDSANSNIDISSLNKVFHSLTKNMENMYHMIRLISLPNNVDVSSSSLYSTSHNNSEL